MSLLDIFKRKTNSSFPENELEKSLMLASSQVSARDEFYQKLLWNDLLLLTNSAPDQKAQSQTLEKNTTVEFLTLENGHIPIFTSSNRIFDKGIIKEKVPVMAMKGLDLFNCATNATFILNPYSDYGKELTPREIKCLLDGSIFDHNHTATIEKDTQVKLGQPANFPSELTQALNKIFEQKPFVKSAYLGAISMENDGQQPHLIVAIELEEELSAITNEAGPAAEKILQNEIIDFIKIQPGNSISDYFLTETQPFYQKV